MPRPPIPLPQSGANSMWTSRGEKRPAGSLHYAVNMFPASAMNPDSPWVTRGAVVNLGTATAAGSAVVAMGQFFTVAGVGVTWLLSSTSGIWTFDWGTGLYTNTVTAANFATATISLPAQTHYWCNFNNLLCVNPSDGTQKPWTWNGTAGAGGLTELNNAPTAYGQPTVRSAKLFFIKYAFRDTVAWSEEVDATLGYGTAPYTNEWKLGQTGTAPLYNIKGTNEGLYYARAGSIGVIRGEVSADFVTTSTHDAVSTSVGTLSPSGMCVVGGDIFFLDQFGIPRVSLNGGTPQALYDEWDVDSVGVEPFGFDLVGVNRSSGAGATVEVFAVPVLGRMSYETVWFHFPATTPTSARACLVVSRGNGAPLGWVVPYTGAALKAVAGLVTESTSGVSAPSFVDGTAGRLMVASLSPTADRNAAQTLQTTSYRLMGQPLGANLIGEMQFDRLSVALGSQAATDVSLQMLTSRRATSATVGSAQTVSANTGATEVLQRYTVGTNQNGRFAMPVLTIQSAAATLDVEWGGWNVLAYPVSTSPTVP